MNLEVVEEQSRILIDLGERIFQIYRFADTDMAHVERLERWAEFPSNARVIDMGCGTGEMARIMSCLRLDLDFTLVNISPLQLERAHFKKHCCDFRSVPEADESFDAAMFCFSIGHGEDAICEARRLLKPGGILFIYDMVGTLPPELEYTPFSGSAEGFMLDWYMEPQDRTGYGRRILGAGMEAFANTRPAIWRGIKC